MLPNTPNDPEDMVPALESPYINLNISPANNSHFSTYKRINCYPNLDSNTKSGLRLEPLSNVTMAHAFPRFPRAPSDIIMCIFECFVRDFGNDPRDLRLVCRIWNNILLKTPRIWAKFTIEPDLWANNASKYGTYLNNTLKMDHGPLRCFTESQVKWILAITKAAPLHICIRAVNDWAAQKSLVKPLFKSKVCCRIENLVIQSIGKNSLLQLLPKVPKFLRLKELDIFGFSKATGRIVLHAPLLRKVTLSIDAVPAVPWPEGVRDISIMFPIGKPDAKQVLAALSPVDQFTNVRLRFGSLPSDWVPLLLPNVVKLELDHCVNLMPFNCPRLTSLVITFTNPYRHLVSHGFIVLPELRFFKFDSTQVSFLSSFSVPKLEVLELVVQGDSMEDPTEGFLYVISQPHSPFPKHITIQGIDSAGLARVLTRIPTLESITLKSIFQPHLFVERLHLLELEGKTLPHLNYLCICPTFLYSEPQALEDALKSFLRHKELFRLPPICVKIDAS